MGETYTRAFNWGRDENTGENGWIPSWLAGVDSPFAGTGDLIAHDTLEHEAGENDGNVENETRALGAAYFVRGETGWFGGRNRGNPDPAYHIAGDFVQLFEAFAFNGDRLGDIDGATVSDMLPVFRDIVRAGIRNAIAEHKRERENREALAEFARARRWFEALLCEGYDSAASRFGSAWGARELFERIARAAEDAARHAEDAGAARFVVKVDPEECKFSATCEIFENPTYGDEI